MPEIVLESFREITTLTHPKYLVKPLYEMGTAAMLFGPSGTGKSFVAVDLACSVATGLPFAGMPTRRAPVVYITAEGGTAFGRRIQAWYQRALALCPDADDKETLADRLEKNLHVIRGSVQVGESFTRDALVAAIREKVTEDEAIGIIVVDTLARCAIGFEENSNDDMTRFVDAVVNLKTRLRATGRLHDWHWNEDKDERLEPVTLLVHHSGHTQVGDTSGRLRERGASALRAALDVVVGIEPGEPLSLVVHKMKDGEEPAPMCISWDDTQTIGFDEDGVEMRGRVAVVSEPGSAKTPEERKREAKVSATMALAASICDHMERRPDCTISELAEDLGISRTQVGRIVKMLKDTGRVTHKDGEYRVIPKSQSRFLQ